MKLPQIFLIVLLLFTSLLTAFLIYNFSPFLSNPNLDEMSCDELLAFTKMRLSVYERNVQLIFLTILAFTLAGLGMGYVIRWITEPGESFYERLPFLEVKVISFLRKSGGRLPQFVLRQKLGISKVKMTRLIKKLEKKNIVKVYRGRTNYVELSFKG